MSRVIIPFLLLCALVNAFPTFNLTKSEIPSFVEDKVSRVLPNSIAPVNYDLSIRTNLPELDYTGTVRIEIRVLLETNLVILNQFQIDISEIVLSDSEGEVVELVGHTTDDDLRLVEITTVNPLVVDQTYFVNIVFNSVLRSDNYGFYRTSYVDDEGVTNYLAATQFQPERGSSAFPCFDETRFRATFDIKLTHRTIYGALGNMPGVTAVATEDGFSITTFEQTPTIPTYLIAFVISNFEHISNAEIKDENDHHHRVFAQTNKIHTADFALKTGNDVLNTLEELFEMTYLLPKMDQIAIPNLAFGAMEHWGLVTYRPSYLLFEDGVSSEKNRQDVATIISHEFTHQFFGNSITPQLWAYAWLNEGFATLYEFYLTDMLFPEMRLKEQFVVETLQTIFVLDATPDVRPMTYLDIDVADVLDSITYSKAGSVLRMMNYALHEETFVKGLRQYLAENIEGISTPGLLFNYLQLAVTADSTLPEGITVADVMNSWTLKSGYPVVKVTRDYSTGSMSLYQERFLSTPVVSEEVLTWFIPYNFASANRRDFESTNPIGWMEVGAATKAVETTDDITWSSNDWVIFNVQQTGYYRVNYDNENWKLIAEELNNGKFEDIVPTNRAQLIDDSLNLANAEKLDYEIALEVVSYLQRETDLIPLKAANNNLNFLRRMLIGKSFFKNYILTIFTAAFTKYGVDEIVDEPAADKLIRPIIVDWVCSMGSADCLTKTSEKLKAYIAAEAGSPSVIEPDMKRSIFCNGLRQSGSEEFVYLFKQMQSTTDLTVRNVIIDGLNCVEDPKLIEEYLWSSLMFNWDVHFYPGESLRVFLGVINNGLIGLETSIEFIEKNYQELYNTDANTILTVIRRMSENIVNEELAAKYSKMIEVISTGLEIELPDFPSVTSNLEWQTKHSIQIQNWIEKFLTGSASTNVISMFCVILGVFVYLFNNSH